MVSCSDMTLMYNALFMNLRSVGRLRHIARVRALLFASFLAIVSLAEAQSAGGRVITLADKLSFAGEVKEVWLVVSSNRRLIHAAPASWIEAPGGDSMTCVGRVAIPEGNPTLEILFIALGPTGNVRSSFRAMSASELQPTSFLSAAELRDRLVERRGALRQLQREVRSHDERLERLQEDADAIASVSRIVSTEDELSEVKNKVAQIDLAYKSIEQRSAQMKSRPTPLNAQTREAQLTQQLAELSSALSATETNALKRISKASGELQDKLRLIEETREEKITLLEEELADARREQR